MSDANEFIITLTVDGMYYQQAKRMREFAIGKDQEFVAALSRASTTENDLLNKINTDGIDALGEDDIDAFSSEMHENWQPLQYAAAALYSSIATTHMLCAGALEAHINIRAEELLKGGDFAEFDRCSLSEKWLSYPPLKAVTGRFDAGRQPFQNFQTLIKRRNALAHYKDSRARVKVHNPYDVPPFVQKLGLTTKAADESLATVQAMVSALATMEGNGVPEWIDGDTCVAFRWA